MSQRRVIKAKPAGRSGGCGCSKRRVKRKKKSTITSEVPKTAIKTDEQVDENETNIKV